MFFLKNYFVVFVLQILVYESQLISRVCYSFVARLKKNRFCVLFSPVGVIWPFVFISLSFSQNKTHSQAIVNICSRAVYGRLLLIPLAELARAVSTDLWESVLTARVMSNVLQETATGGAHSTATLRHTCPPARAPTRSA